VGRIATSQQRTELNGKEQMGIEATGTIRVIGETQQVSAKFQKRQLVLELADNPKYPQMVEFALTGDRCVNLDGFNVGEKVRN
jgi:hypothetical protein